MAWWQKPQLPVLGKANCLSYPKYCFSKIIILMIAVWPFSTLYLRKVSFSLDLLERTRDTMIILDCVFYPFLCQSVPNSLISSLICFHLSALKFWDSYLLVSLFVIFYLPTVSFLVKNLSSQQWQIIGKWKTQINVLTSLPWTMYCLQSFILGAISDPCIQSLENW